MALKEMLRYAFACSLHIPRCAMEYELKWMCFVEIRLWDLNHSDRHPSRKAATYVWWLVHPCGTRVVIFYAKNQRFLSIYLVPPVGLTVLL